jgi:glutamate--cysteine ligase catalytic subunit
MGLLAVGTPLEWPEAKKNADHVREWGIEQLLAIWRRAKGKERDALLWGDEVPLMPYCSGERSHVIRLNIWWLPLMTTRRKFDSHCDKQTF